MVPLVLKIKNFLSYSANLQTIDFQSYPIVCLSGKNGHGKSAMLDAISWAIWGQARKTVATAKPDQGLLRVGQNRMQVQLDFQSRGQVYRVVRDFYSSGGRSVSNLEFQIKQEDGEFRPLTDKTIRDTQNKIVSILGLDFETFLNTSFFRQNSSNEFSKKTPRERKNLIGSIIGLDRYDQMSAKAGEMARQIDGQIAQIRAVGARLTSELNSRKTLDENLGNCNQRISALARSIDVQKLEQSKIEKELEKIDRDLFESKELILKIRQQIPKRMAWRKAVLESGQINLAKFEEVRSDCLIKLEKLDQLAHQHLALSQELLVATEALAAFKAAVIQDISERRIKASQELEFLKEKGFSELAKQESVSKQLELARHKQERTSGDLQNLKEQLSNLEKAIVCPTCGQSLPKEALDNLRVSCAEVSKKIEVLEQQLFSENNLIKNLEKTLEDLGQSLQAQRGVYQGRLLAYKNDFSTQSIEAEVSKRCSAKSLSLAGLSARQINLSQELAKRPGLQAELQRIEDQIKKAQEVRAVGQVQNLVILDLLSSAHGFSVALKSSEEQGRRQLLKNAQTLTLELEKIKLKLAEFQAAHQEALRQQAILLAEVERLDRYQAEVQTSQVEIVKLAEQSGDFNTLAQAYGKNGIQALLIDSVIPEIEAEANKILSRLSDSSAKIFIESLRDLKKGGFRESLDIKIVDSAGVRPYEMFSGGEAFRIDFALRIGISKLLASRAGAALQTLIIDEGFGSQDAEGLARLMEAIYAIKDDFKKIIIVSHLQELKDEFPVHFVVKKTNLGSTVTIEERF